MSERLSIIVATRDRAPLLNALLGSLTDQTVPSGDFEVIVVDHGSTDETAGVCARIGSDLRLRYLRIGAVGDAAARNVGIFASRAPILLFLDDDQVADGDLLRQHLLSHVEHPADEVAILGRTGWFPGLEITPVMEHVMHVDHFMFDCSNPTHGEGLDFSYFWSARSSCKRALLVRRGIFDQTFRDGYADVELGYRLATHGFKVVANLDAVSFVNRPVTYDGLCRRCERRGRASFRFARVLYPHARIEKLCDVVDAEQRWRRAAPLLDHQVARIAQLETSLGSRTSSLADNTDASELRDLYAATFRAYALKGIVTAALEAT